MVSRFPGDCPHRGRQAPGTDDNTHYQAQLNARAHGGHPFTLYEDAFTNSRFGYATAQSVLLFGFVAVLMYVQLKVTDRYAYLCPLVVVEWTLMMAAGILVPVPPLLVLLVARLSSRHSRAARGSGPPVTPHR